MTGFMAASQLTGGGKEKRGKGTVGMFRAKLHSLTVRPLKDDNVNTISFPDAV